MQQIIEQLAAKHGCDLGYAEAYLRLDMLGFDRLSIERIAPHQISVAHYFEDEHGDLVADPELVFLTSGEHWVPIAIGLKLSGWHKVALLNDAGDAIRTLRPKAQREAASFANMWAKNIREQGWLADATLTKIKTTPTEQPAEQADEPHETDPLWDQVDSGAVGSIFELLDDSGIMDALNSAGPRAIAGRNYHRMANQ
jgi:hypothetical protein